MSEARGPADAASCDYRVRRSDLSRSVRDSDGFSVYDAITARIDWQLPQPWLTLLQALNDSQRSVVALAQVHEHATFNGLQEALKFHGAEVVLMAAQGAAAVGSRDIHRMLTAALDHQPDWDELEDAWDRLAGFEIAGFIEAHAEDFFIDE